METALWFLSVHLHTCWLYTSYAQVIHKLSIYFFTKRYLVFSVSGRLRISINNWNYSKSDRWNPSNTQKGLGRTEEVQRRNTGLNVFSLSIHIHFPSFPNCFMPWDTDICGLQLRGGNGKDQQQTSRNAEPRPLFSCSFPAGLPWAVSVSSPEIRTSHGGFLKDSVTFQFPVTTPSPYEFGPISSTSSITNPNYCTPTVPLTPWLFSCKQLFY